jgi:hypothetical protein
MKLFMFYLLNKRNTRNKSKTLQKQTAHKQLQTKRKNEYLMKIHRKFNENIKTKFHVNFHKVIVRLSFSLQSNFYSFLKLFQHIIDKANTYINTTSISCNTTLP